MVNNEQMAAEEETSSHPALSLLSILRTIWKRKAGIVVSWALFAVCAVAIVRALPSVYMAETVVLIDSQKIPEKFVSATVVNDLEERIASIRQMLLSGGELKKVIEEFGLYRKQRTTHFEEEILEMMRKDITITLDSPMPASTTKRPGAFRIGYQGSDPALVMQVANRLTDLYVQENLRTREGQAAGTSEFLDSQLGEAKKRLDEMEAAVSSYKLEHNGELPQQEAALSGTLTRLQTELEANRDAINRAQQTKVILESSVNAMESTIAAQTRAWEQALRLEDAAELPRLPGQPAAAQPARTSEALETELAQLRARYTESHPDVVQLRAQVENVKRTERQRQAANAAAAANATPSGSAIPNRTADMRPEPAEFSRTREQALGLRAQIKGADTELETRKAEQERILRDINLYQRRMERLPVREQEMAKITRDYEMSKENYKSLLDKRMAAEMSLDMERRQQSERFVVLDRARLPEKPVKPKRPVLYAAGSAVSLLLALLLGFGAEFRKNVFLGEWELPAGTPVLARLPFIEVPIDSGQTNAKSRGWFSQRKEIARATVTMVVLAKVMAGLHSVVDRL